MNLLLLQYQEMHKKTSKFIYFADIALIKKYFFLKHKDKFILIKFNL